MIVLVAIATPVLGFYGALDPEPHDTTNLNWLALYWALGVVVLSAVWFGIVRVMRPTNVANAAAYAAEHTAFRRSTRRSTTNPAGVTVTGGRASGAPAPSAA